MSDIVLATHGLTRTYGQSRALDGVSITVPKGEIYGLVGRNGAGKTTLMRLVTGQSHPDQGSLELFGQTGRELERARSRTGAMPYVAFYRAVGLEETIARAGFLILERERLFRVPPSLFVAARKGGN